MRGLHASTSTSGCPSRCGGCARRNSFLTGSRLNGDWRVDRYLPLRSRWLQPGQQQGRRAPSSSSSCVRRMRRSRVTCCLAFSTQQMNSLRAKGVMSRHASSAAGFASSALRRSSGSSCTTPSRHSLAAHESTSAQAESARVSSTPTRAWQPVTSLGGCVAATVMNRRVVTRQRRLAPRGRVGSSSANGPRHRVLRGGLRRPRRARPTRLPRRDSR